MSVTIQNFLESLTSDQLDILCVVIHTRKKELNEIKIANGDFVPLTEFERLISRDGNKLDAVRLYRERMNCSVSHALAVVDHDLKCHESDFLTKEKSLSDISAKDQ